MKYIAIIIVAAFIVGALGINFPFAFDDFQDLNWIRENLSNQSGWENLRSCFAPSVGGLFSPFRNIVGLAAYKIFGLSSPIPYHLLGIIFHVIVALCCFFFANHIIGNKLISFVAAFLFAIFPYHYWSIWWIANFGNPMLFALFLLSFFTFIKWVEGGGIGFLIASFLLVNLSFLTTAQGAIYPLAFLLYVITFSEKIKKSVIRIAIYIFLVFICDVILFSSRGNYAAGGNIIDSILFHSLDIWQKIMMFNIFTDPQMPASRLITLVVAFILAAILLFEIKKSKSWVQFFFGSIIIAIGPLVFIKLGIVLFVKYLSAVFFIYYFIFGNKLERFFVCLTVIFSLIFFTVGKPMLCSRYLYSPNFAFSILIAVLLIKNIDRLFISSNIKKLFLIVFLSGFTLMSAVFYYDKFKDWSSVCNLEWEVLKDAAVNASKNARVVFANSRNLFRRDIPLNKWMSRPDLVVDYGYGVTNEGFYLGDAYFADFNNFILTQNDRRFNYTTGKFREIRYGKTNAFVYNKVYAVNFSDGQNQYIVLSSGSQIDGILVNLEGLARIDLNIQGKDNSVEFLTGDRPVSLVSARKDNQGHIVESFSLAESRDPIKISIRNKGSSPLRIYSINYNH
ncbi:MAG: hypothetical protein NTX01_05465 [Candidatus Omnitrophica bacterium]|nr:hypothetical protein [Candidatus Omnitrophota bacterium]